MTLDISEMIFSFSPLLLIRLQFRQLITQTWGVYNFLSSSDVIVRLLLNNRKQKKLRTIVTTVSVIIWEDGANLPAREYPLCPIRNGVLMPNNKSFSDF